KKCIRPGKPGPGKVSRIILMEGLVHKSSARMGGFQTGDTRPDLLVGFAGHGPHDNSHGPDGIYCDVGAAYSLCCLSLEVKWIVQGKDKVPGVFVDFI